jgi:hypothetical protein
MSDGRVLVAGGDDGSLTPSSTLSSVAIYHSGTGWSTVESMKTARFDDAAVLLKDGRILVAGGADASGAGLSTAEVYDPTTGHWSYVGRMSSARAGFTLTVLSDGRVLAVGGYGTSPSQALASADIFDPTSGGWTGTGSMSTGRRYHSATALSDGRVLVIGGHGDAASYLSSCEIYTPPPARVTYPATTFHPLDPARILDSRSGNGLGGFFYPHVPRRFQVAGRGGVPLTGAVAVTGILTSTGATSSGYLTIGPVNTASPDFSILNFPKLDNRANNVAVALDADGMLSVVYVGGGHSHALFDVTGYFTADNTGATFFPLDPKRILDSRDGTGGVGKARFVSAVTKSFPVRGVGGVSQQAVAVTGNLTVVNPSTGGWAFVGPSVASNPGSNPTSTVNAPAFDTRADGVTAKLATDGSLSVVWVGGNASTADLLFDVTGYYVNGTSGAKFVPLEPIRMVDTRYSLPFLGPIGKGAVATVSIAGHGEIPSTASGISGNLTVTLQTQPGFITVAPQLTQGVSPTISSINFPVGDNRANGFFVRLNSDGTLATVYEAVRSASTHYIIDVTGYFAGP